MDSAHAAVILVPPLKSAIRVNKDCLYSGEACIGLRRIFLFLYQIMISLKKHFFSDKIMRKMKK